jgi:hypothetical protein
MKNCSNKKCAAINPQSFSAFSKNSNKKDGLCGRCKTCAKEYDTNNAGKIKVRNKRWKATNPDNRKNYELKKAYGITLEEYRHMLLDQNYSCAICCRTQSELKQTLNVDHCHITGKVRGLLCSHCNHGIGIFRDSVHLLTNAIQYLNK